MRFGIDKQCSVSVIDTNGYEVAKLDMCFKDKADMMWHAREAAWSKGKNISHINVNSGNEVCVYNFAGEVVKNYEL